MQNSENMPVEERFQRKHLPSTDFKPPLSPKVRERANRIVNELIERHASDTIVYSSCTGCGGCFSLCPLKFRLRNGKITAVEPDDTSPFVGVAREDDVATDIDFTKFRTLPRGCVRKHALRTQIYAQDRVLYPMKRDPGSKRGDLNGKFIRITWEDAINLVAEKMKHYKDKNGPSSIMAPYGTYPSRPYTIRLLSHYECGAAGWALSSWDTFRHAMRRVIGKQESIEGPGPGNNAADILLNSKLIIGWGWVPSVSQNGNIMAYYVKLARERGVPVIWIDPRYTKEAECLADQWIPIRPGSDPAMMMAMAYVLFKEECYDKEFITNYVEPLGFQKWKDYIIGVEDQIEKTPEWAEKITGVPAETIKELAILIAHHKPTFMKVHISIARHSFGDNVARAGYYLQCMYGHIGMPGAFSIFGWYKGPPVPVNIGGGRIGGLSLGEWGKYTVPTLYRAHKWAQAILLLEKVKNGELSKAEYDKMVGNAYPDLPLPDYKMAINETNTLVSSCTNTSQGIEAIKKLDLFVTRAWHWNTTARAADLVIPVTEFYEEYLGVATDTSGGPSCVGLRKQLVEPQGEARPWEWFLTKVAEKLGFADKFNRFYATYGDDWAQMQNDKTKSAYEVFQESMNVKGYQVPNWEEFEAHPYIVTDEWRDTPFSHDWKTDITAGKLGTPSKKIGKLNFISTG
jgi:anaerobic dimethyl sulfoxide reductase subunit A